ncbi:MAG: pitrilysin family protein [Candidatus Paceibacterota bacterium]
MPIQNLEKRMVMRWKASHHDLKSNGIRVYYFYDSGGTTHICGVGYRVGSIHDPVGVPHLVEHILFRGKPQDAESDPIYNMIFRYFGGMENHNIFTTWDCTYYGGPGLYRRSHIHEVLPIIVSALRDRYLGRLGLSIEKTVINNEYRQTDLDNPNSQLSEAFYQTMYETNPVRNPIIGYIEQLKKVRVTDVKRFIERHYVAENMFVIVVGPKREEAIAIAKKYLDDWPHKGSPVKLDLDSFDRLPRHTVPRIRETTKVGLAQNYVMVGYSSCCHNSRDDAAVDLIERIIERRLYDSIREKSRNFKDGTYHNPTFTERSLAHGVIGAWFATASQDFAKYGRDAIVAEFRKLREELVPGEMLDGARDSLREGFFSSFRDTPEEVVEMVIAAASGGDPDLKMLHSYPERLKKLTPIKIREIANNYFDPNGFTAVTISPA